ncbi:hypothetical protein [Spiroplasma endosymbiont of Stenodema calcarata]|uniref:hypothetical protein n=1 Tax=Spiroplasma endosymbiont of Stenodema calcarata TaxID=3139328 RepID=UPI003CCB2274
MADICLALFIVILFSDLTILLLDHFLFTRRTSKLKLENAELQNKINYLLIKKLELEKKEDDN